MLLPQERYELVEGEKHWKEEKDDLEERLLFHEKEHEKEARGRNSAEQEVKYLDRKVKTLEKTTRRDREQLDKVKSELLKLQEDIASGNIEDQQMLEK